MVKSPNPNTSIGHENAKDYQRDGRVRGCRLLCGNFLRAGLRVRGPRLHRDVVMIIYTDGFDNYGHEKPHDSGEPSKLIGLYRRRTSNVVFARHRFRPQGVSPSETLPVARAALRALKLQTREIEFLPLRGLDAPVRDELTAILEIASWRWNWLAKRNGRKTPAR